MAKPFDGLQHLNQAELQKLRESIDRDFRKALERQRKEEEDRYKPRTSSKKVGKCTCGGKIVRVKKTRFEIDTTYGPPRIGGSNPMKAVVTTETCCTSCKLLYSNSGRIQPKKKTARS